MYKYYDMYKAPKTTDFNIDLDTILQTKYPMVYKVLELAEGKLSLCGGAIIDLLNDRIPNDFDMFFYSLSVGEADILLNKCLQYLKDNCPNIEYYRSHGVISAKQGYRGNGFTIQFIRRIYQTKDQILLGFDMMASRLGYNICDGFFATIDGAISNAIGAFPLDLTQRSLSHGHRLSKYIHDKGFKIFLPGLSTDFQEYLSTPDGNLSYDGEKAFVFNVNYDHYDKSDYDEEDDNDTTWMNWWYLSKERYDKLVFKSKDYRDLLSLDDKAIRKIISIHGFVDLFDINVRYRTKEQYYPSKPETFRTIFGDDYKEFAFAYFVENDKAESIRLWNKRWNYYVEKVKQNVDIFTSWRTDNPGGQNFGKFNPVIADPREWYGEQYQPVLVGLSSERVATLKQLIKQGMPAEVIDNICDFWLASETLEARKRLFALC